MISDVCYDFVSGHIQRYDLPSELNHYLNDPLYADTYQGAVRELCTWASAAAHDPAVPLVAITATLDLVANILAEPSEKLRAVANA
jgi:hypothetical protein